MRIAKNDIPIRIDAPGAVAPRLARPAGLVVAYPSPPTSTFVAATLAHLQRYSGQSGGEQEHGGRFGHRIYTSVAHVIKIDVGAASLELPALDSNR